MLTNTVEAKSRKINEISSKNVVNIDVIKNCRQEITELKTENSSIKSEIKSEVDRKDGEINRLKVDNENLSQDLLDLKTKFVNQTLDINNLEISKKSLYKEIEDLKNGNEKLIKDLGDQDKMLSDKNEQLQNELSKNSNLSEKVKRFGQLVSNFRTIQNKLKRAKPVKSEKTFVENCIQTENGENTEFDGVNEMK